MNTATIEIVAGTDGKAGYRAVPPSVDVVIEHKAYGRTYTVPLRELMHFVLRGLEGECDAYVTAQIKERFAKAVEHD